MYVLLHRKRTSQHIVDTFEPDRTECDRPIKTGDTRLKHPRSDYDICGNCRYQADAWWRVR